MVTSCLLRVFDVTVHGTAASATVLDVRDVRTVRIVNRSGSSAVFDVYECETETGTFVLAADLGTSGRFTIADGQSAQLHASLLGCAFIKLVRTTANGLACKAILKG